MNFFKPSDFSFPDSATHVGFRRATLDDFAFFRHLHLITMKPLVEAYFPWDASQQEELQKKSFHYDRAWILSRGSQNTGFLQLQETSFSIEIEKFYLLPEWQGLGIGTTLFEGIINHANKEGKKLTLSVLKNNRAKSLYQRLGFTVQDENHYKFMMEWNNMPSP